MNSSSDSSTEARRALVEPLAREIARALADNPGTSPEQALEHIGGPLRAALEGSPELRQQVLDEIAQMAATNPQKTQPVLSRPGEQEKFAEILAENIATNQRLGDALELLANKMPHEPQGNITINSDGGAVTIKGPVINQPQGPVTITNEAPRSQKIALPILVVMGALALAGLGVLIYSGVFVPVISSTPAFSLPSQVGPALSVKALAIAPLCAPEQQFIWIAAGVPPAQPSTLYRLDLQSDNALPTVERELESEVLDMKIDCRGNIWILERGIGARAYSPKSKAYDVLINTETPGCNLKQRAGTLATGLLDDGRNVIWLGNKGVREFAFSGDYPDSTDLHCVDEAQDQSWKFTKELESVSDLLYDSVSKILWVADPNVGVFSIPTNPILEGKEVTTQLAIQSLGQVEGQAPVAGGDYFLKTSLATEDQVKIGISASTVVATPKWIWFGGSCKDAGAGCKPLGLYSFMAGKLVEYANSNFAIGTEIRAIVTDHNGKIWIGSDAGLFAPLSK